MSAPAALDLYVDGTVRLGLYRTMATIRAFELAVDRLHRTGELSGSFHSSVGQESCAAGVCAHLGPEDLVTSTHRGHAHAIAKGVPVDAIMCELFGRTTGTSAGKGGSMHLHHRATGFLGETAIVGGALAWAAGSAWARRRVRHGEDVTVAFLGDGGYAQGVFHESLRMAKFWSSPCLFVCENNGFAHSMRSDSVFGPPGAMAKAIAATGVTAVHVDGTDVTAVHRVAGELIELVRSGQPAFLECSLVRVPAHALSDVEHRYREKDEGRSWLAAHDPLARLRQGLEPDRSEALSAIDAEIGARIEQAIQIAIDAPHPTASDAFSDIYADTKAVGS